LFAVERGSVFYDRKPRRNVTIEISIVLCRAGDRIAPMRLPSIKSSIQWQGELFMIEQDRIPRDSESDVFSKHLGMFIEPAGPHLTERTRALGEWVRAISIKNIKRLRDTFSSRGIECLGQPSSVVPVTVGDERLAKWTSHYLEENGLIANLVEFPAVARGRARFRFQVMATHTVEQIDEAVKVFCRSLFEAHNRLS
jgi:hypothetical protein